MKSTLNASLLVMTMFAITAFSAGAAERSGLRYFSQPADVNGSSIPYGNNEGAGKYVLSGDAGIYYETYGSGKPIVVLEVVPFVRQPPTLL